MSRLGIVTGLIVEADCTAKAATGLPQDARPLLYTAGGDGERARLGARGLIEAGASGLLSFGLAGGLSPGLGPGTVVMAETIVTPDGERIDTDPDWRRRFEDLARGRIALDHGAIAGVDQPVTSPADKARLHQKTGAVAADMESHGVAAVARDAGIAFLALRVVADPATRAIPEAALAGLGPDGRRRPMRVLMGLVMRPGQLGACLGLARDSTVAMAQLRLLAALGPPLFAFP